MYLESWLNSPEYVKFELQVIPQVIIIEHDNIVKYAVDGLIYANINKAGIQPKAIRTHC